MWQTLTFSWATPLLSLGCQRQLELDDLEPLLTSVHPSCCGKLLLSKWLQELDNSRSQGRTPSLLCALIATYGQPFFWLGSLELCNCALNFAGPLLLNHLLENLSKAPQAAGRDEQTSTPWMSLSAGYAFAALLVASLILKAIVNTQYGYRQGVLAAKIRAALTTSVFRITLRLKTAAIARVGAGRVQTLMSVDADRVVNLCLSFHQLWSLPLQIALALWLLYTQVRYAFLAGLSVVLLLLPVNRWLALRIQQASIRMMAAKDRRVRMMMELLRGIKQIKSYAWEAFFQDQVARERRQELAALAVRKYMDALCVYFWAATSLLFSVSTFGLFVLMGQQLTASLVFTSLALFNVLIAPLNAFPWVVNGVVEALVSVQRVGELLAMQADSALVLRGDHFPQPQPSTSTQLAAIRIEGGYFGWDAVQRVDVDRSTHSSDRAGDVEGDGSECLLSQAHGHDQHASAATQDVPLGSGQGGAEGAWECGREGARCVLSGVDVRIPAGALAVVVGEVGAGKSALLSAMLGQLHAVKGTVEVCGSVAYGSQNPWVQRGSIRDNILFGMPMDQQLYQEVLHACGLDHDLRAMPAGDLSLVGEEGSRLSGGQRARLALARALYADRDVYILDAVLAGLDVHVAAWLTRHALLGPLLRTKTVVIVTNSSELLAAASHVVRVERGGRVTVTVVRQRLTEREGGRGADAALQQEHLQVLGQAHVGGDVASRSDAAAECVVGGADAVDMMEAAGSQLGAAAGGQPSSSLAAQGAAAAGHPEDGVEVGEQEKEEERGIGHVPPAVYLAYVRATGWLWVAITVSSLALMQATRNGSDLWLAYWVAHTTPPSSLSIHSATLSTACPDPALCRAGAHRASNTPSSNRLSKAAGISLETSSWLGHRASLYLGVLLIIAAANSVFTLIRAFSFAKGGMVAAKQTHQQLLCTILRLPMSFFDGTPTGRVVNRFSSDTAIVDDSLPFIINILLANLASLLGVAVVLALTQPAVLLLILPLSLVYKLLQQFYRCTSRELRRLEALARSPVYTTFSEALSGGSTIQAFGAEPQYQCRAENEVAAVQRVSLASLGASNWLSLRLQLMAAALAGMVAGFAVMQHQGLLPGNYGMSAELVGLSLAYVLPITGLLSGLLTSSAETEQEMVAMERLLQYTLLPPQPDIVPSSSNYFNPEEPGGCQESACALVPSSKEGLREPLITGQASRQGQIASAESQSDNKHVRRVLGWPRRGHVVFEHVWLRYNDAAPDVLKGLCLEVLPGTKLGVCGRTGAGKSSLIICLLQLAELNRGQILIDGQNIARVPLLSLRTAVGLVPQNPLIFQGTIQQNLDPFTKFSQEQLIAALQLVQLWDHLVCLADSSRSSDGGNAILGNDVGRSNDHMYSTNASTNKSGVHCNIDEFTINVGVADQDAQLLRMDLGEGGINLSLGQQQLLCLARVLLMKPQILCLDECTANIDPATAKVIHEVKSQHMERHTVIEIAHQLESIISCDQVAVMETGQIVEVGKPGELLKMTTSVFHAMVSMPGYT